VAKNAQNLAATEILEWFMARLQRSS